ncbi:MAG: hypothetical protein KAG53_01505, partial [Endozoicomonadaceae bacterium]|nr:hypothetical protein [Endozoicomonadaceae bacterium]
KTTLMRYLKIYNYHITQKALCHIAPTQSLKDWAIKYPEIFTKRVYNQARPDSYHLNNSDDTALAGQLNKENQKLKNECDTLL